MDDRTAELLEAGARERVKGSLGEDPFAKVEELREAGRRKAEAEGVAYQLDHERQALLARLQSEYAAKDATGKASEAKLDRLARADERYASHLRAAGEAQREKAEATSEYHAIRSELDLLRATLTHETALARLGE